MNKIETLTPEQEALMPVYRDKWIEVGLDNSPLDKKACIEACKLMCEYGEEKFPEIVVFKRGPREAINYLISNKFIKDKEEYLNNCFYGSHEAGWVAFYDYMKEVLKLEDLEAVEALKQVARTCGWVYSTEQICVIIEKPLYTKFDENMRLHCENGPALYYSDGTAIYSWHGVTVRPEWIEHKENLVAEDIIYHSNMEERRVLMEIFGWNNILKKLNAITIDKDVDPEIGELLEVDIPDVGRDKFLRVLCGTGREFAMPVPPTMKTALEANAWTYDIPADLLKYLEFRT